MAYGTPDFTGIIDAFQQGKQDARRSYLQDLEAKGKQLAGQALGGDMNALRELYVNNPELGMNVANFTREQKAQRLDELAAGAMDADTPEKWAAFVQRAAAQGHVLGPGETRESIINEAMGWKEKLALDLRQQELNKPPASVQEYEYGVKHPDFAANQLTLKAAGRTNVNVNNGQPAGETQYQKSIGEQLAKRWGALAEEGDTAQEELSIIGQLRNVMPEGGLMTGISGKLAEWGVGGKGLSDIQATQALVDRLTPKQRVPGSGTSSDLDVRMFKSGMPSLWRTPEGNQIIMDTMEALALNKQARGEIAYQIMDGTMTRQQAVEAFKKLPDPFARFKEYRKRAAAGQDRRPVGGKSDMDAMPPGALRTKNGVEWSIP